MQGEGELFQLVRNFDWDDSAIGPISLWPSALQIALNNLLHSPLPGLLLWGTEFVQIYNDAFVAIVMESRDHPQAFGKPVKDSSTEITNLVLPYCQQVQRSGIGVLVHGESFGATTRKSLSLISCSPVFDDAGANPGILVTVFETTDENSDKTRLLASESRLHFALNAGGLGEWDLDLATFHLNASKNCKLNFGQPTNVPFSYSSLRAAIHPDDRDYQEAEVIKAIQTGTNLDIEYRVVFPDESVRWVNIRGQVEYDDQKNPKRIIGISVDITHQKNNEAKMLESKENFRHLAEQLRLSKEAAELGTFDLNLLTGELHWDDRCRILFGTTHSGPVTYEKDFVLGLHPEDRERILRVIDNTFNKSVSNGDYDVEYRTVGTSDGVIRWVRAKGKAYFDSTDRPVRFIGSVLDVTEKTMAIQRIEALVEARTQELALVNDDLVKTNMELKRSNANLEEFAHAASHDLKEPIRKIRVFTSQLKTQLGALLGENETHAFARIENATVRMGNLIDDLLLYSHVSQRSHEKENIDLNEKVRQALVDLDLNLEEKKAVVNVSPLPIVKGHRRQLQQLFQNLISNAVKYSKQNESPVIDIDSVDIEKDGLKFHLIRVTDNGIGFEQQYEEKIFRMFSRLHGSDKYGGTGVGLSIVKKIVENHDGRISVTSEPGKGSRFEILLPY
ncbi:MAG: PAS domain-containing protein [Flavitalea sp.]